MEKRKDETKSEEITQLRNGLCVGNAIPCTLDAGSPIIEIVLASLNVVVYPLCNAHESIFDILAALRACLDVFHDTIALGPLLCLLTCDFTLVVLLLCQIGLVANQNNYNVRLCDLSQVVEPVGDVLKGLLSGEIEDKQRAACTAEV
ncbi:hypothetical protein HG531_012680 [Fusarium graminearum]|nr:hypothetical protein HG531_012680 [Fusarium graminearum]